MTFPLKANISFETEKGLYSVAFGKKQVFFYKNLRQMFLFPFDNRVLTKKINNFLKERDQKFGNILILGENPKIVDIFLAKGLFNIYYSFEDKGLKEAIFYNYPSIIYYLRKANTKILKESGNIFLKRTNLKFDLIIKKEFGSEVSEFFKNQYLNLMKNHLKENGIILINKKNSGIMAITKDKSGKTEILAIFIKTFVLMLLILLLPLLVRGNSFLVFISLIFSTILYFVLDILLFSLLSDKLNSFPPLFFTILFLSYFISFLVFKNISPSKSRLILFSVVSTIILLFSSIYGYLLFFYLFSFLLSFFYFPLYFKRIGGTSGL